MKRLIIAEVNSFRAEVRAQARAAGQIRRQERSVVVALAVPSTHLTLHLYVAFLSQVATKS
jgi:hypothetical protein